jgi:hypothetical protein
MSITEKAMTPQEIVENVRTASRPAAGAVMFNGNVYDRKLRRCRLYAVADGAGGMEWRVAKEPFDFEGDGSGAVERCFRTYAEAMKWLV